MVVRFVETILYNCIMFLKKKIILWRWYSFMIYGEILWEQYCVPFHSPHKFIIIPTKFFLEI